MTDLSKNLRSGIVVFLMALPLCLGIALACNVPLFSGILAGLIGGILVTIFSGSTLSVSGPAAGLTSIVIASVASLGSYEVFLAAVFFAGIFQLLLAFLKAGNLGNYIPVAVIKGMLAGIGIILIMKQIPHIVGYDRDPEGDFDFEQSDGHNTISDLYYMFNYVTPAALIIGVVSLLLLLVSESKFYKKNAVLKYMPGALLVVLVGALITAAFHFIEPLKMQEDHMVTLPLIRSFSDLKANLFIPDFSQMYTKHFWMVALTLAAVASLESLLSIEATDKLDPEKRMSDTNKELLAQGLGNMASGLIGALPVTAVIVRSSANINAGATKKSSAIFHAVLLFIAVIFFPSVLMLIPNAALAAILIMTGYKLTTIAIFKTYFKKGWDQFLPFIVTVVVMLVSDLLKGVGAGLMVSIFFIIRNNVSYSFDVFEDTINGKKNYLIKLPQHLTFFNKGYMIRYLKAIENNSLVMIDGAITKSTDKDVKEIIEEFIDDSKEKNIEVQLIKYTLN
jgi:MFS superfamily sulfate permease-like transporter